MINKVCLSAAVMFVSATAFAGTADFKDKTVVSPELFRANEFQVGIFGAYGGGSVDRFGKTTKFRETTVTVRKVFVPAIVNEEVPVPAKVVEERDKRSFTRKVKSTGTVHNAFGGGIETSYFLTNNFGIALEGTWLDGESVIHAVSGSLIYRCPIERGTWAVAPYAFIGGGGQFDGSAAGFGHFGGGAEVRFSPHWGIFLDGRWVIHDSLENYALVRSGVRLVF